MIILAGTLPYRHLTFNNKVAEKMRVLIIPLFTILAGCVPKFYEYHNIVLLPQSGLRVANIGKIDLDNLYFNSDSPLEYEINRVDYTVAIHVYGAEVYLKIVGHQKNLLNIVGNPYKTQLGGVRCSSFSTPDSYDKWAPGDNYLNFSWYAHRDICFTKEDSKVISFSVYNSDDELLGQESLPFEVLVNGRQMFVDAI